MEEHTRKRQRVHENRAGTLGELIHAHMRRAIETAVHEELLTALRAAPWERSGGRRGYRNGRKERTLTGPTGPLAVTLPRGLLFTPAGSANGPRRWSPATSGGSGRSTRRCWLPTWPAATRGGFGEP